LIINILSGKPLPVYGDGNQIRDWLHVADHCAAISLALTRGEPGEVYNIGGNSEFTNLAIVRSLCALVDEYFGREAALRETFPASPAATGARSAELITHVRDRPGHDRRSAINYSKAQRLLGYSPARDLGQGLRATLEWYLGHQDRWRPLLGADYATWLERNYVR
jgi:dTDP-glucose 4,6-dehydratase